MDPSIVTTPATSLFLGPPGLIIAGVILLTVRIVYTILAPKYGWKISNPAIFSTVTLLVGLIIAGGLSLNMNYSAQSTIERVRAETGMTLESHEELACTIWQKRGPERTVEATWTERGEEVTRNGIVTISGPVDGECEIVLTETEERPAADSRDEPSKGAKR